MEAITPDELKRARVLAGWTQEQLADRLGLHYRSVANWERGLVRITKQAALEGLLEAELRQVRGAGDGNQLPATALGRSGAPRSVTPEPWASAMLDAGMESPDGSPNQRELTRRAQAAAGGGNWPSHSVVREVILGGARATVDLEVLSVLARVLHVPVAKVASWAGSDSIEGDPWSPPDVAALMDSEQRALVNRIIEALVRGPARGEESGDDRDAKSVREGHEH